MSRKLLFLLLLLTGIETFAQQRTLSLKIDSFVIEGHNVFIILPKKPAKHHSWIWYAPTLPGLPAIEEEWMFRKFLDAGIAIAGIDVGESYGSPDGRKLFSALYNELVLSRGFSKTPVLLGRSRGGLMTLNWAADNPEKVAAFAGIYPVCNLESYPGLDKAAPAFHGTSAELKANLQQQNPVSRMHLLAQYKIPLFAIHGDVDELVPLNLNSGALKKSYDSLGARMQLVVPAGQGHNMWEGFFQSKELVQFVIRHAK